MTKGVATTGIKIAVGVLMAAVALAAGGAVRGGSGGAAARMQSRSGSVAGQGSAGAPSRPVPARPAPRSYPHDANGLQRELQPFLDVYAASVASAGQTLSILVIPDGDTWFGSRFPAESVARLAVDQKVEVASYEQALINSMRKWPPRTQFRVNCLPHAIAGGVAIEARVALPTRDAGVEAYQCTFAANADSSDEQRAFVNLGNFVYVDGAYRFVGGGFYPFWAMAAPSKLPAQ